MKYEYRSKFDKVKKFAVEHKTEIVLGITVTAVVIGGIIVWKNKEPIIEAIRNFKPEFNSATSTNSQVSSSVASSQIARNATVSPISSNKTTGTKCEHSRKEFIRNFTRGQKASSAKRAEAIKKGIVLGVDQTIVNACTVNASPQSEKSA